ncbi:right-handed parallel beta-helix repeat-containing protein [Leifsonia poae]|uniref:right-handed parallel beta-helix repeat-containing protein n=1 Tax=Leifsonia poae TaxID=110933 RepID=UPI003D691E5B
MALATALTAALAVPVGVGVAGAVAAPAPLVSDSFTRTVGSGFGTATPGGAYTNTNAAATSVASGTGVFTLRKPGTGASSVLRSVSASDVTASAKFAVPTLPTKGSGIYAALQARISGTSRYEAVIRFTPSKTMTLQVRRIDGSTTTQIASQKTIASGITAGTAYTLEFSVTGSSPVALKARVTPAGGTAGAWQASGTDSSSKRLSSGSLAVWSYLSQSSTAATVKVDDFVATGAGAVTTPSVPVPTKTPTATPTTTPSTPTTTPTPAPTTTPTTQPTAPSSPSTPDTSQSASNGVSTSGARHSVGSAAIGSTGYAVPAGAVFAAAGAAAGGNGTQAKPYASAQAAVSAAPTGGTVVLRGGTYHESVSVPSSKKLTIQSYPGEAVWFDGSQAWGGWSGSGSTWVSGGYSYAFDNSPSFNGGLSDAARYIDPAYPMAATPDQVFIDGVSQRQVNSRSAVTAGTFYVDKGAHQLVLGSNPSGHSVRVSTLQQAMVVQSVGTTVRGIGFERYATSAKQMGAVTAVDGVTLENLAIVDNATVGLYVHANATLRHLTIARNGMLGAGGNEAYGLKASNLLVADNNSEHFKKEPVSGGFKITRSRGISITDSAFLRNATTGLWLDESVYDAAVTGNDFVSNGGDGVEAELSAHVTIANNVSRDNTGFGIRLFDTSDSAIWNNTSVRNSRNISLMQDARRQTDLSVPGHDPRRPAPDPTLSWILQNVSVSNNVLADAKGIAQLTVEDLAEKLSGNDMRLAINGNLYQRTVAGKPSIDIVWMQTTSATKGYATAEAFAAATGQDSASKSVTGSGMLSSGLTLTSSGLAQVASTAKPLPSAVAGLIGQPAGTLHLGSW